MSRRWQWVVKSSETPVDEVARARTQERLRMNVDAIVRSENNRRRKEISDEGVVQVQFPSGSGPFGGGNTWTYRCLGAQVGDWVVVPPTPYNEYEQFVPVVGLGRRGYNGPVKTARLAGPHEGGRVRDPVEPEYHGGDASVFCGSDPDEHWNY